MGGFVPVGCNICRREFCHNPDHAERLRRAQREAPREYNEWRDRMQMNRYYSYSFEQQAADHGSYGSHNDHSDDQYQGDSLPPSQPQNALSAHNTYGMNTGSVSSQQFVNTRARRRRRSRARGRQLQTHQSHIDVNQRAGNRENAASPERLINVTVSIPGAIQNNQQQTLMTHSDFARGRGGRGRGDGLRLRAWYRGRGGISNLTRLDDSGQVSAPEEVSPGPQLPAIVRDPIPPNAAGSHGEVIGAEEGDEMDGAAKGYGSLEVAEAPMSRDAGHPELPNPPCSMQNNQVWPYDFQKLDTHRTGRIRPMVWPCKCQAELSDGKICGQPHPTKIHADHKKFLEIWLPIDSASEEELGVWRLIPDCPIDLLDDHLTKFVTKVSDTSPYQPFHISFYSPTHFDPPARELGWPEPLAEPMRLTVGWFKRGSNPLVMNQSFRFWCKESAKEIALGIGFLDEK